MKKRAFTLAEVLTAFGIVAVIAAIMLPLINKFRPDSTKVMYLKTYDSVIAAVKDLSVNTEIYPLIKDNKNYNRVPFYNTEKVTVNGQELGGDSAKLCEAIARNLNTVGEISCSSEYKEYTDDAFSPSFKTHNGVQVMVLTDLQSDSYQTDIYFDVNGDKGNNCLYSESCKNPDRFKLIVASNGHVVIADPVGQYYFDTRSNWKLKDIMLAENSGVSNILPEELLSQSPETMSDYKEDDKGKDNVSDDNGDGDNGTGEDYSSDDEVFDCTDSSQGCSCGDSYNGKRINCIRAAMSTNTPGRVTFKADFPVTSNVARVKNQLGKFVYIMPTGKDDNSVEFPVKSNIGNPACACGGCVSKNNRGFELTSEFNLFEEDSTYIYALFPLEPFDFQFKYFGSYPQLVFTWDNLSQGNYRVAGWLWEGYGDSVNVFQKSGMHIEGQLCGDVIINNTAWNKK